jgi:3-deoxy-D-manno-octulosonic-acid transferase
MYLIYNILLFSISFLAVPFILFAVLSTKKYRSGLSQKTGFVPDSILSKLSGERPIWIHAVSVGEVITTIPLIRKLKENYPDQKIVLSTVTVTGNYTATLKAKEADAVIYFPYDYPFIVKRAIKIIHPKLFITLETELWPNFLRSLKHNHIPSILINGRISNNSYYKYRWTRFFFSKVLANINAFYMQTDEDARRIINIGAPKDRVITVGNLKYDRSLPMLNAEEKKQLYNSLNLKGGQKVFIAGSTHRGEEEIILDIFKLLKKKQSDLILILAPRHPERFNEVANLINRHKLRGIRRTFLSKQTQSNQYDVILLDTIGELSKLYSLGTAIFVGGSLVSKGGHNVLEPVVYKKAVLFGPHMDNFLEISSHLKNNGGGLQVQSKEELLAHAEKLLSDDAMRKELGEKAFEIISHNQGAIEKAMEVIGKFIGKT